MYKKSLTLFVSLFLFIGILSAAAPVGYYTPATLDGKNTSALRTALQSIIDGHTVISYTGLWTAYATTDINPSTGKIWDMYSNCSFTLSSDQCGTYSVECDCYNREHTTPQSWFSEASPMVSDLFNVYPTDGKVNGMRNNYPYGEVGSASYTSGNGSLLGTSNFGGYSGIVFEPIDTYKGDFARTCMYMAVRYAGQCESWGNETYGSTLGLTPYSVALFLKWSREDPVSAKEIARNDAVYALQDNRNPFIDFPGLEEYIWGNNTSGSFTVSGSGTTVVAPTVTSPTSANLSSAGATLGGNITSLGEGTITENGIYYSTTTGFANGAGTKVAATSTATSTGAFTVPVSGLAPTTTYYYKAFATNSAGSGYSTQGTFVTTAENDSKIVEGNVRASGETLVFGKVTGSTVKDLYIKTQYITGDLTVAVSGTGFTVSTTSIPMASAQSGYTLNVTFNPTSAGSYSGTLTISGGSLPSNYQVSLTGSY